MNVQINESRDASKWRYPEIYLFGACRLYSFVSMQSFLNFLFVFISFRCPNFSIEVV